MLAEMTAEEFQYWEMLERIEPFGERAAYERNALLCAVIANVNRAPNVPAYSPDLFLPPTMRSQAEAEEAPQTLEAATPEAIRAVMTALMQKQNAFIATQDGGGHA